MHNTFLSKQEMLTVILQCETAETAIGRIRNANHLGADAYGLQVESLKQEYQNTDTYKRIFAEGKGRPFYVTNYRGKHNIGKTDEELAEGLATLAESVSPSDHRDIDYHKPSELAFMGRTGTDRENAELICFLASDKASYISGQNIQIDGCRKKQ